MTRARICQVPVVVIFFALIARGGLPFHHKDNEQDLTARIDRESNPVKKAKLQVRLGRLKLNDAVTACNAEEEASCGKSLDAYLTLMRDSWKGLQATGRKAAKHPQGFRALEFALRENEHLLEDLKRDLPYADHARIDKILDQNEGLHKVVFRALFPGEGPSPKGPLEVDPGKNPAVQPEKQP